MKKLGQWLGNVLSGLPAILSWLGKLLERILKGAGSAITAPGKLVQRAGEAIQGTKGIKQGYTLGKGLKGATNAGLMMGGITGGMKGIEYASQLKSGLTPIQIQNLNTLRKFQNKYKGMPNNPFD